MRPGWAIEFRNCGEIAHRCREIFSGWGEWAGPACRAPGPRPRAIITQTGAGWHWRALGAPPPRYWAATPPLTPMHVVCEVHDALIDWYRHAHPHHLALHGAAADLGDGLVVFPSVSRSGKSVLMAHLAFLGSRIFSDDILPLEPGKNQGVALGLAPRLRAPLPRRISTPARDYIERHCTFRAADWIYMNPGAALARHGKKKRLAALVLLDRRPGVKPRLQSLPVAPMLRELTAQNFARREKPAEVFDRLHALCETLPRLRFSYSDPLAAAEFLIRELS